MNAETGTEELFLQNPILPGFNPDPAICRVGDDLYIATSTFEWYPGVQIFHSRDLVHWRLACRPLSRASQLDLRGNPDCGGVWAPGLSHAEGRFWLVYTDMKRRTGNYKDAHNYLVTAPSIEGPWTDPVYLGAGIFDPSLFHDDDGRKWLLAALHDHRARPTAFAGIVAQEFSVDEARLVGTQQVIFCGTELGMTEAPHLMRRDGWYYLVVAEGGTGYDHAVTHARARELLGPYELHPELHPITSRGAPQAPLQRAGHGQIVELGDGTVWHTHLCSRPIAGTRLSPLGRESAIQRCIWGSDGWLRLEHGGTVPAEKVPAPDLPSLPWPEEPTRAHFENGLPGAFQWLRTPFPDRLFSTTARPGWLRLYGREGIGSRFEQALVARRLTHHAWEAETLLDFAPTCFRQAAGLVIYYNSIQFHYLAVTADDAGARVLTLTGCTADPSEHQTFPLTGDLTLPDKGPVGLRATCDGQELRFFLKGEANTWSRVGPKLDMAYLSDESGPGRFGSYTGAFAGMAAQDLTGFGQHADFAHFTLRPVATKVAAPSAMQAPRQG